MTPFKGLSHPAQLPGCTGGLDLSRSYDPDPYPFWHQAEITGGQNYSQWDNRTASEYLEQARVIADPVVPNRLYRNFPGDFYPRAAGIAFVLSHLHIRRGSTSAGSAGNSTIRTCRSV